MQQPKPIDLRNTYILVVIWIKPSYFVYVCLHVSRGLGVSELYLNGSVSFEREIRFVDPYESVGFYLMKSEY